MFRTKRVKLTRSLSLHGRHAEKGSVHDLAPALADDLIAQESAVLQNIFFRWFARLRFLLDGRAEVKGGTEKWTENPKKRGS
jgi:hypothetical protein